MIESGNNLSLIAALGRVTLIIGIGLIAVGVLEHFGIVRYRSHREPVGTITWLVIGTIITGVGFLMTRIR